MEQFCKFNYFNENFIFYYFCLRSTNWDEVKTKDYEGKDRPDAPKGQEWAKKN